MFSAPIEGAILALENANAPGFVLSCSVLRPRPGKPIQSRSVVKCQNSMCTVSIEGAILEFENTNAPGFVRSSFPTKNFDFQGSRYPAQIWWILVFTSTPHIYPHMSESKVRDSLPCKGHGTSAYTHECKTNATLCADFKHLCDLVRPGGHMRDCADTRRSPAESVCTHT